MKKKSLFLAFASMFMLASCGGGGGEVEEASVENVYLSTDKVELKVGDEAKKVAYRVNTRGDASKEATITSENEAVATVAPVEGANQFAITPVGEGETKVNVVSKADTTKAASLTVIVAAAHVDPIKSRVTGILLDKDSARLTKHNDSSLDVPATFTVTLTGEGNYDVGFTVNNEHPDIVSTSISEGTSGMSFDVTPLAVGTALIDVIAKGDKAITKQIQILVDPEYVPPVEDHIDLDTLRKELDVGESFTLNVTSASGDVNWSLDPMDSTVVSLADGDNSHVVVNALAYGEVDVIASVGSAHVECKVIVKDSGSYKGFGIKVGGGELITLSKSAEHPDYMLDQYTTSLSDVAAGTTVDFFGLTGADPIKLDNVGPNKDDFTNLIQNNLKGSAEDSTIFVVQQDFSNAKTLYFEVYQDGYGFWLEGGPELSVPVPMLVGLGGDWDAGLKMSRNPDTETKPNEYVLQNVSLETTDEFKFKYAGHGAEGADLWAGMAEVKGGCKDLFTGEDNMSVKESGKYTFYWDLYEGIWAEKFIEPLPEFINYHVDVDGIPMDLNKTEVTPEGMVAQYTATITAKAEDEVIFYGETTETSIILDSNIRPNGDDTTKKIQNNIKPSTVGGVDFAVLKDCVDAKLYFEVYEDYYGFWLEGGPEMLSGFYLKVNGEPAFTLVDDGDIEGGYHQYKALAVSLSVGDTIQLYDADNDASWMCALQKDAGEYAKFDEGDNCLEVNTAGTYDFYVKMKSGEDLLYIGKTPSTDPTITFKASSYNVVVGNEVTVEVETENCGDAEVEFSIEEGFEYAEVKDFSGNNAVVIGYDKGDATITATVSVEGQKYHAEATIHVLDENVKSVYFHNPYTNFTEFSLYLFKGETHNADWPGEALSGTTYSDKNYGDCYKVDIDLNAYDKLILTAKENDELKQTRDISLSELGEKNLVMFDTNGSAWKDRGDGTYVNDGIIATFTAEVVHEFAVSIDEETPVPLTLDEGTMPVGVKHQWSTDASLDAGAGLEFTMDGEEFTNITLDPAENNNAHINLNDLICVNNDYDPEEGHKSLYLKELTDGTFVLFVAGGVAPEPETQTITLTFKDVWAFYDDAKMFVWAWSDSKEGTWFECSVVAGMPNTMTVELPADLNHFKVCRCHKDTVTPNWSEKENVAGCVYNEGSQLDISGSTTSFDVYF